MSALTNFFCAGYFGFVRLFRKFFYVSKGSPFNFFLFCKKKDVQKLSNGTPFTFFGTARLTGDQKKFRQKFRKISDFFFQFLPNAGTVEENRHFEVLLLFLSFRYGAELGRSRLVYSRCLR